jgi:hypothetical protein
MFDRDEMLTDPSARAAPASETEYLGEPLDPCIPCPPDDLQHALNYNQIACKSWLLHALFEFAGKRFGTVTVLGGWYGVLGTMLLDDRRLQIDRVLSVDIDPNCARVAEALNRKHVAKGRFEAVTADAFDLEYQCFSEESDTPAGAGNGVESPRRVPNLVVNTSCEHMTPTRAWYDRVPPGMLQILQSNDYFDCPDHVNCMADLEAFEADVPMRERLYQGTLARKKYTRFMLIGRK